MTLPALPDLSVERVRALLGQQVAALAYLLAATLALSTVLAGKSDWAALAAACTLAAACGLPRLRLWRHTRGAHLGKQGARRVMRQIGLMNFFEALCVGLLLLWAAPQFRDTGVAFLVGVPVLDAAISLLINAASGALFLLRVLPPAMATLFLLSHHGVRAELPALPLALTMALLAGLAWEIRRRTERRVREGYALQKKAGQLLQQTADADGQARQRARLLAAASHDMRQPMHALTLYLDSLAQLQEPGRWQATLGSAQQCANTMAQMFGTLLDLSQEAGAAPAAQRQAFPLARLLNCMRNEFLHEAEQRGLRLHIAPCSAWVDSDPVLVQRILRNLLLNACQNTRRGKILVGARRRAGQLELQVLDTGVGIAPEVQQQVFDEFFRGEQRQAGRSHGLGLGLSLVRHLADQLSARLTLRSIPGRGSCFAISLPLAAACADGRAARPLPEPSQSGDSCCVLVIDDDPAILDASSLLLAQWGYHVVTACDSEEALARLAGGARPPDVLLCDFHLRDETGLHAIKMVQARLQRTLPALLVTGDTTLAQTVQTPHRISVLHKPLHAAQLQHALRSLRPGSAHAV